MDINMEIDLKELYMTILRRVWLIILSALLGAVIAYSITVYLMVPQYTSSLSMYVFNSNLQESLATSPNINLNDINASKSLVNTYIVVLQDDIVFESVAEELLQEYPVEWLEQYLPLTQAPDGSMTIDPDTLRDMTSMGAVNATEVLQISVESPNADISARICMIIAESGAEVLERVVKAGSVEVISPAKPAYESTSPNLRNNCIIGFIVGGILLLGAVVVHSLLDSTVKNADDVRKRFDIPVLGEIPDFTVSAKIKKYNK